MMTLTAMTMICQRTGRPDSSLLSVLVDAVGDGLVLGSIMEWNRGREGERTRERGGGEGEKYQNVLQASYILPQTSM